ncbi:MAG TPA: DnaB-like helicase C-terminal domain-containing protein [Phycisphaerae bacterium]|nr:DnaB-like helicase C-terminal domain-containing protein [Phycisphaerae bacterium]
MDRVPPHSIQAEACVLGSMILGSHAGVCVEIRAAVSAPEFYRPAHQEIFAALCEMEDQGKPIELPSLRGHLSDRLEAVGGIEYLVALVEGVPDYASGAYYAGVVRDKARLRQLIVAGTEIVSEAFAAGVESDAVIELAERRVYELAAGREDGGTMTAAAAAQAVLDRSERIGRGEEPAGLETGFPSIDYRSGGGFRPGQLIVVAASTSRGKTALVTDFGIHVAAQGGSVRIFSLEMSCEEMGQRILQAMAQVNGLKIALGKTFSEDEAQRLSETMTALKAWGKRVVIHERPMGIHEIAGEVRRAAIQNRRPLDLVVIDYLQITPADGRSLREEINTVTRGAKMLAKDTGIPILLLSQLSRQFDDKPPELWRLKESSNIEHDADGVIMLWRPAGQKTDPVDGSYEVQCCMPKWRNGWPNSWHPDDVIKLRFTPQHTSFREI